ncbi:MAG: hypothetical protein K2X01_03715 [Cyanobacteria bacterium]|nr:hypothetical protein [Cyanobacteriota bacterium]
MTETEKRKPKDSINPDMPPTDITPIDTVLAQVIKRRSLLQIIKDAFRIYRAHRPEGVKPLLLPVFAQIAGVVIGILLPYKAMDWMIDSFAANGMPSQTLMLWIIFAMFTLMIPGVCFLTWGFWRFLVLMASMNASCLRWLAGETYPGVNAVEYDYQQIPSASYSRLLAIFMGLWLLPPGVLWVSVLLVNLLAAFAFSGQESPLATLMPILSVLLLLGGGSIILIILSIISIYCSLSFQIISLEPALSHSAVAVIRQSIARMKGQFWRGLAVMLFVSLLTSTLIPMLVGLVFDLTQLTALLKIPVGFLTDEILHKIQPQPGAALPPYYDALVQTLLKQHAQVALETTHYVIFLVVSLLLLPLSSLIYTLFYLDIRGTQTQAQDKSGI